MFEMGSLYDGLAFGHRPVCAASWRQITKNLMTLRPDRLSQLSLGRSLCFIGQAILLDGVWRVPVVWSSESLPNRVRAESHILESRRPFQIEFGQNLVCQRVWAEARSSESSPSKSCLGRFL